MHGIKQVLLSHGFLFDFYDGESQRRTAAEACLRI